MNIAILDAGAIGCYYGAKLQAAGHPVTYITYGVHLEAIQSNALVVKHPNFYFCNKVHAVTQKQWTTHTACGDFDLIIFALKNLDFENSLNQLSAWLQQGCCPILSLQNDFNSCLFSRVVGKGRAIHGRCLNITASISQPGYIQANGQDKIVFSPEPPLHKLSSPYSLQKISAVLNSSNIHNELE